MLQLDAGTLTKYTERRVLLFDCDADLQDRGAFPEHGRGDSGCNMLQKLGRNGHLAAGDADKKGVVGCTLHLVVAPGRRLHIHQGRDGDVEIPAYDALMRVTAMMRKNLNTVDTNLYLTI